MKQIWIRHGQTDWNVEKKYLGHANVPLNSYGIKQAEKLGAELKIKYEKIDGIFTSDLDRCLTTAQKIAKQFNYPLSEIISTTSLRELNFGKWDGSTYDEICSKDRRHVFSWYDNPYEISPPNGETLKDLEARLNNFLDQLKSKYSQEDTIIIVTHGGLLRLLQSKYQGSFWSTRSIDNGQAISLMYDKEKDCYKTL